MINLIDLKFIRNVHNSYVKHIVSTIDVSNKFERTRRTIATPQSWNGKKEKKEKAKEKKDRYRQLRYDNRYNYVRYRIESQVTRRVNIYVRVKSLRHRYKYLLFEILDMYVYMYVYRWSTSNVRESTGPLFVVAEHARTLLFSSFSFHNLFFFSSIDRAQCIR